MRHFTTITQWRILKYFWRKQDVFTVEDLLEEKIIHFPALGRLTLEIMEARGQVMSFLPENGETIYIATTDSKEEWRSIWPSTFDISCNTCFRDRGLNWYERQKVAEKLEGMLEDFRKRNEIEE